MIGYQHDTLECAATNDELLVGCVFLISPSIAPSSCLGDPAVCGKASRGYSGGGGNTVPNLNLKDAAPPPTDTVGTVLKAHRDSTDTPTDTLQWAEGPGCQPGPEPEARGTSSGGTRTGPYHALAAGLQEPWPPSAVQEARRSLEDEA